MPVLIIVAVKSGWKRVWNTHVGSSDMCRRRAAVSWESSNNNAHSRKKTFNGVRCSWQLVSKVKYICTYQYLFNLPQIGIEQTRTFFHCASYLAVANALASLLFSFSSLFGNYGRADSKKCFQHLLIGQEVHSLVFSTKSPIDQMTSPEDTSRGKISFSPLV